ncbi:MAG: dephospho-CoA kinase [Acholeplasma sp.]|nr:dephospho-CoA kinase [Acholeplasma sp.]
MKTLCITGGIATGKSLVTKHLKSKGFSVIDADQITHELLKDSNVLNEIKEQFSEAFTHDKLDKSKLAQMIFSDTTKKETLDGIMHKKVYESIFERLENHQSESLVAVDIPLLYETNHQHLFDYIVVVSTSRDIQLKRLMNRNQLTKKEALDRINAQMDLSEKTALADFVIDNSGSVEHTYEQVNHILNKLKKEV